MSDPKRAYRHWTSADDIELRELYEYMTAPEISEHLGRTPDSIRQRVTRMGFAKQAAADARMRATLAGLRSSPLAPPGFPEADSPAPPPLPYPANSPLTRKAFVSAARVHAYFAEIASADQAYILGLLAADGNIGSAYPRITLGLQAKDMRAVEFARDRLNPAAPLCALASGMMVLQVSSRQMAADLARFGIVPRKSRTLTWPGSLGEFQRPFLLGYFDGDGSMYLPRDRHGQERPGWTVCSGSEKFLIEMRDYILSATGVQLQRIQHRAGADLWQVSVTGLGAAVIDEWLHQEGIGLARKRFPARVVSRYLAA